MQLTHGRSRSRRAGRFGGISFIMDAETEHERGPVVMAEALTKGGKISKGENYKGLPYLVLDYPRKFKTQDIFAYRVMFWWGHYFSATLLLGHMDLMKYRETIVDQLEKLHNQNVFFCVNDSPWEHHFQKDNYVKIDRLGRQEINNFLVDHQFIKLSKKLDLDKWELLPQFAVESLILFLRCLDKID